MPNDSYGARPRASRAFPISPDDLTNVVKLSREAQFLIVEVTNAIAHAFGSISAFYRKSIQLPDSPAWAIGGIAPKRAFHHAKSNTQHMLGRGARHTPDWATVVWVADICLSPDERAATLGRWAGWWCAAQTGNPDRPPGYDGPVVTGGTFTPPADTPDPQAVTTRLEEQLAEDRAAHAAATARFDQELAVAKAEARGWEARLVAAMSEHSRLHARDMEANRDLIVKNRRLNNLDSQLAQLRELHDLEVRTSEVRMRELTAQLARCSTALGRAGADARDGRQLVAVLIANLVAGRTADSGRAWIQDPIAVELTKRFPWLDLLLGRSLMETATAPMRRFATYVHAHLLIAPGGAMDAVLTSGISPSELAAIVAARIVPSAATLDKMISVCPAIAENGPAMRAQAASDAEHHPLLTHWMNLSSTGTGDNAGEWTESATIPSFPTYSPGRPEPATPSTFRSRRSSRAGSPVRHRGRHARPYVAPWLRRISAALICGLISMPIIAVVTQTTAAKPTLRVIDGQNPVNRTDDNGRASWTWTELSATPLATTIAVEDGQAAGLAGTLRVVASDCAPTVDVLVIYLGLERTVTVTGHSPYDMGSLELGRLGGVDAGQAFTVFLTQTTGVDKPGCQADLTWDEPGTR